MSLQLNLIPGTLVCRPNRFIFEGILNGDACRLHCPANGSIGGIQNFSDIPCLVTPCQSGAKRTTRGTVDAISIDRGTSWIGINQNRINGWVEQLLRCDGLKEIVSCVDAEVQHEVKILDSRLDLCILRGTSRTYIEIKTPIHDFLLTPQSRFTKPASKDYFARGIRHFHTLGELAAEGHRSIVILCFMYDACPFVPPNDSSGNAEVFETVRIAEKNGMESWQVNFTLTPDSFSVKRIQRLSLCKRAS